MKQSSAIVLVVLAFLVVGCATIITGTNANVSVSSNPSNAAVTVTTSGGVEVNSGTTPIIFRLSRANMYVLSIKLEGYKEVKVSIDRGFNAWYIGNILCGGVLGLIIDAVDGAMWKLEPEQVHVELVTAMRNGVGQTYAVLGALDDDGQLRTLAVPLIRIVN